MTKRQVDQIEIALLWPIDNNRRGCTAQRQGIL